jgi:hypothetical protein
LIDIPQVKFVSRRLEMATRLPGVIVQIPLQEPRVVDPYRRELMDQSGPDGKEIGTTNKL